MRNFKSSRSMAVVMFLLPLGLIVLAHNGVLPFGWDGVAGGPGGAWGTDAGLLLLWGIGHCDTMDGPVVGLARRALEEKNVNLVLPWVQPDDEHEIRHVFEHAQAVRALGPQAQALADRHFIETLVRVHRAGEGAPFTGIKPAGLDLGPAVPAADRALESGSVDALVQLLTDAVNRGVRSRFQAAREHRAFAPDDVSAGRQFVAAYVPYVHYVEKLWELAAGEHSQHPCGGHKPSGPDAQHEHHH